LSVIIWSITLIVSVKYIFIVLQADDDGQGGTFALYSLLARYARITTHDPRTSGTVKLDRHLTGEMAPVSRSLRSFIERSGAMQFLLKAIGVLGVSMIMADGILTPAQSVSIYDPSPTSELVYQMMQPNLSWMDLEGQIQFGQGEASKSSQASGANLKEARLENREDTRLSFSNYRCLELSKVSLSQIRIYKRMQ
jgi:hypothetical protein